MNRNPKLTIATVSRRPQIIRWTYASVLREALAFRDATGEAVEWVVVGDNWSSEACARFRCAIGDASSPDFAVRAFNVEEAANCGALRNTAIRNAWGELLTWHDDDDWHHPDRTVALYEALRAAPRCWWASYETVPVLDLRTLQTGFRNIRIPFAGGGLFYTDRIRDVPFDETRVKASDVPWTRRLREVTPPATPSRDLAQTHMLATLHGTNTGHDHSGTVKAGCREPLERFVSRVGHEKWGLHTSRMLKRLQAELCSLQ